MHPKTLPLQHCRLAIPIFVSNTAPQAYINATAILCMYMAETPMPSICKYTAGKKQFLVLKKIQIFSAIKLVPWEIRCK
jgi:hypothetical protein